MPTYVYQVINDDGSVPRRDDRLLPLGLDGDGNVGASDLLALLANWGPCP